MKIVLVVVVGAEDVILVCDATHLSAALNLDDDDADDDFGDDDVGNDDGNRRNFLRTFILLFIFKICSWLSLIRRLFTKCSVSSMPTFESIIIFVNLFTGFRSFFSVKFLIDCENKIMPFQMLLFG